MKQDLRNIHKVYTMTLEEFVYLLKMSARWRSEIWRTIFCAQSSKNVAEVVEGVIPYSYESQFVATSLTKGLAAR
jgi:hypothetical protein